MKIPCSKDLETTAAVARCSDFPGLQGGLPHSEIVGSKLIRSSPTLIAAYHVLHRLCMPRHPPVALKTLDRSHCQCPSVHVPEDRRSAERYMDQQKDRGEPQAFKRWHWHKKTSFSRSVRGPRSGKPISCRELSVPGDEPHASPPGRKQRAMHPLRPGSAGGTRTNLLFTMSCRTGGGLLGCRKLFSKWMMVEPDGIEPTTPCLQSRCSPS